MSDMEPHSFVQKGAASLRVDFTGTAQDFYFLLLPRATMLAVSSAIEPLRIANQVTGQQLYRWFTMTEDGGPVRCSNGVLITPDSGLVNIPRDAIGFVCSGTSPAEAASSRTAAWLNRQQAFGITVGGICTGAFALARAGLLRGRRFTLHWENQPSFVETYPDLHPTDKLYEHDGKLLTCGGGGAATDMMLDLIEARHGKDLAIVVSDMCIHARSNNREAPQKSTYSVALGSRNQRLLSAMQYMNDHLEEPVEMAEIADHVQISRRQLERLFRKYVSMTPSKFYFDLRLSKAHALLNETNLSITEIAIATGFSSPNQLTARFRRKFGVSPSAFKKGWADG